MTINILHTPKSQKKLLSATAPTTHAPDGFQQNQAHASSPMGVVMMPMHLVEAS
jgi:hypothetical protein